MQRGAVDASDKPKAAAEAAAFSAVRFAWPGSEAFEIAIDSFALARGERLMLLGPSGSGKSTFLSLLAGIAPPQSGSITVLGSEFSALSNAARDHFRAEHFGIIFQMFNLLPYASLIDNVLLPLHFSPRRKARAAGEETTEQAAVRLLSVLGLGDAVASHARVSRLSVGQQQRVAAARALIGGPEIIVADEPTSALDRDAQGVFLELLFSEAKKSSSAIVMVSHDESLGRYFDRVARLDSVARVSRGRRA